MPPDDPFTQWLVGLKADERAAAEKLWQDYWRRVSGLARKFLSAGPKAGADEEDVAQSVFRTFVVRLRKGEFPKLDDPDDLWRVLATITFRKSNKQRRREIRQPGSAPEIDFMQELARELSHEDMLALQDEIEQLLSLLDDDLLQVVLCLMQGMTNQETAKARDVVTSTVERKRKRIREIWNRHRDS